jgi:hypothetical protein
MATIRRDTKGRIIDINTVEFASTRGEPRVIVHFAEVEGRLECVRVDIGASFDEPEERAAIITSTVLRGVPIGDLIARARRDLAKTYERIGSQANRPASHRRAAQAGLARASKKGKRRGGRPALTDDFLAQVAEVYRDAWAKEMRNDPTRAVQDWGGGQPPVAYSTAARWVLKARRAGYLRRTERGQAGERLGRLDRKPKATKNTRTTKNAKTIRTTKSQKITIRKAKTKKTTTRKTNGGRGTR